jgi:hypothetical protein
LAAADGKLYDEAAFEAYLTESIAVAAGLGSTAT